MKNPSSAPALACGVIALALMWAAAPAQARPASSASPVTWWAENHAVHVPDNPLRPGPDLATITRTTAGAQIIGLGEPGHTISEVTTLQARYLRHLVAHAEVRAIAFEMDWTLALSVNDYVLGIRDDLDTVLAEQENIWQTTEMRNVLQWLRHYNDTHADDVEVAGAEYFATGQAAYDAVETYVAAHAPDRIPELRAHYELLEPTSDNVSERLWAYMAIADKAPYVDAAAALERLVAAVPHGEGREVAMHNVRQIHSWYEGFSLPWSDIPDYRDAKSAQNVRWWQRHTGARTVYWAASAHVADAPELTITEPGEPDTTFASAGSHLEDWYGRGYVTVGFTFDHGTYLTGEGQTVDLPPASADWFEQPLGDVRSERFVLDLGRPAPPAVRGWLDAPLTTRGLPEYGSESLAYGGSLRDWFDVLVHSQQVSPAHPL
jgi:erythromycin esterase